MRLEVKLTLLIAFCAAIFLGVVLLHGKIEDRRLDAMLSVEENISSASFDRVIRLSGQSLEMFVRDFAVRDEIYDFVRTGDKAWMDSNLKTAFSLYGAQAAWIYRKDLSLLYSVNGLDDDRLKELPMPWFAIGDLFQGSESCHFFAMVPQGLMEIRGSLIHPVSGLASEDGSAGYFFVSRLWDDKYLSRLASLTGMSVSLTVADQLHMPQPNREFIPSSRILKNWAGAAIAWINVKRESGSVKIFKTSSEQTIVIFAIYSLSFLAVILGAFNLWINIPLRAISKAIVTRTTIYGKGLLRQNNEFGKMAIMINRFLEQRKRLLSEIIAHRAAVSALQLSEEKFAKAFQANPDPMAIFTVDDGLFIDANDVFLRITGYGRDKVIHHSFEDLNMISRDSRLEIMSLLKEPGKVDNMELDITTASGGVRRWLLSMSTIKVGMKKAVLLVADDITEWKRAQEALETAHQQLVQSEKMAALGRFASGIAHEVKNPLAVMLGGMEYLRAKLSDVDPEVREAMVKMQEALMRANIIIKDLLSFAKPSKLIYEKVHPNTFVREAVGFVELFRHKSDTAQIEIQQKLIEEEDILVEADKNQMQQALFNILLNAIEAVSMKGSIIIKTYLAGEFCVIEVRDTGHGISKSDLSKICEPFFTTKGGQKGTGLGLAIVKSIIENHKGSIAIESEIGKGTSVKMMLPIAPSNKKKTGGV